MPPAQRKIVLPEFGKMLREARGKRDLGFVVARMHAIGGRDQEGFSRPQLERYEAGERERPDPVTLMHLATIYNAKLADWLIALAEERERVALLKPEGSGQSRTRGHTRQEQRAAKRKRTG